MTDLLLPLILLAALLFLVALAVAAVLLARRRRGRSDALPRLLRDVPVTPVSRLPQPARRPSIVSAESIAYVGREKRAFFGAQGGGNTQKVPMRPRRCRPERAFGRFCGFSARFFALPKGISAVGRFRSHFASMSLGGGRLIWVLKISTFLFFSDPTPRRTRPAPEAPRYAPLGQPNRTDRVRYALCDLGFPMWRVWCGGKAA